MSKVMIPPSLPPTPRLPSRRASAILATGMLVAGIALGALLGPGPAASLASGARAAAVARVLALMALEGAGQSGQPLVAAVAEHQTSGKHLSAQTSGSTNHGALSSSHALPASTGGGHAAQSETGSSAPAAESAPSSPTNRAAPGAGSHKPTRLPAIGHAWLIVLPYGQSFAKVLAEPAAFPFLSAELRQGTLLSGYSALAAQQLEGATSLLSGAVESAVNTIEPPSEPTGAQAADAFLQTAVGEITATAAYREGGLIAIAFAGAPTSPAATPSAQPAPGQTSPAPTQPTGETQPAPSQAATPGQAQPVPYPAGTQASTLSATATGALLLSPYLRRPGARLTSSFDAAAPRTSIEELLRDSKNVGR